MPRVDKFSPHQRWGSKTYAQHADDMMALNIFELMGIKRPSYLDVGANHPFQLSNTALLYERGSRGVSVDANPLVEKLFKEHRPEDRFVCTAVGISQGMAKLYRYDPMSGRNTISEDEVNRVVRNKEMSQPKEKVDVPCTTINKLLEDYLDGVWPDFLSVDIEGMDFYVLKSADFTKTSPKVICVETRREQSPEMIDMMANKGFFCYCRMAENLFFISYEYRERVF